MPGDVLYASTTPGLEPALEAEAKALGFSAKGEPGGVELSGPPDAVEEACLQLRTANHVLLRLGAFSARDPKALERGLREVSLQRVWDGRRPVSLKITTRGSRLRPGEIAEKVWRLRNGEGGLVLHLRLDGDLCTVSADASGEILHKRGYRQEISRAPLRETLAAGMLLLAGYRGEEPLWDPMCGSGTLPIEAALLARRRAPGKDRRFAFQDWPSFDAAAWSDRLARAAAAERPRAPTPIHATDIHAGSLGVARRNARRAGVLDDLQLARLDIAAPRPPPELPPGLVIANPPYGKRVGEGGDLAALYRALGRTLREGFRGWRAALLIADRALEPALGIEPERALPLDNGGIRCRLLICRL